LSAVLLIDSPGTTSVDLPQFHQSSRDNPSILRYSCGGIWNHAK